MSLYLARRQTTGLIIPGVLFSLLVAACAESGSSPQVFSPFIPTTDPTRPTLTPFLPLPPTSTITPTPTATPAPTPLPALWAAPYLPYTLRAALVLPAGFGYAESPEQALLKLDVGGQFPISRWMYTLVAPFPTIPDGVTAQDLKRSWRGDPSGPFAGRPILMDESTHGAFSVLWGTPSAGAAKILPASELLDYAWDHQPSWAIVPFEDLDPRWKVLEIDGQSPLHKDFESEKYTLAVNFSLSGDISLVEGLLALESGEGDAPLGLPATNRYSDKLTTLAMTGVTALVRATAHTMRRNGITYPAQDVGEWLRSADLAHVSNEVPFAPNCPPPNPTQPDLRFCSDPNYIELLEEIGTDIVELTGDHLTDWGLDATRYTLDLYREKGWMYYGGGYDKEDARQARLMEHNGNRLAFIGCNAKGGGYATAREEQPGAISCDFDWMHREIARLKEQGYLVIATFQHFEYYTYAPQPDQVRDFRGMAEAGAAIVSGSQAHQPQGFEFYKGSFIHYGLGNLFFDQYFMGLPTSQGFIDRHVFYDGRYVGMELLGIRFVDFARPRPMTTEERIELLEAVFSASGW